jgi:hypothetical protein
LAQREIEIKLQAPRRVQADEQPAKNCKPDYLGLVLAALIVGAALIMGIDTPVTLPGYPAQAVVLFLLAVGLGLVLVFNIFLQDIRGPRT